MKTDNTKKIIKNFEKLIEEYGLSEFSVINKETGEIVLDLLNGTSIHHPKLKYKNKDGQELIKFQPKELFVKLYKKAIEQLGKELSNRDFSWFIRLSPYVKMNDCTLRDNDDTYLNVKQLSKLLDVSYDNFKTVMKSFEKIGLIKKIRVPSQKDIYKEVNAIVVNPYLYVNGEYVTKEVKEMFALTHWSSL